MINVRFIDRKDRFLIYIGRVLMWHYSLLDTINRVRVEGN